MNEGPTKLIYSAIEFICYFLSDTRASESSINTPYRAISGNRFSGAHRRFSSLGKMTTISTGQEESYEQIAFIEENPAA